MAELKKCPFCGGKASISNDACRQGEKWLWSVECVDCGVIISDEYDFHVIKAWNNRATEAEIRAKAIDEFLEKLCDVFSENYGEVTVNGIKFDVLTLDGATEITWDVAEQLKEE